MATTSLKTNLRTLYLKYPQLENDYKMYRDAVIQQALKEQYKRNNKSGTLCKILDISSRFFPYIADKDELKVIQDRISDYFNYNKLSHPQYEKWHKKLPVLFKDAQKVNRNLQAVFNLDSDGIPDTISVKQAEPEDETYTIIVRKDATGDIIFNLDNISQSIAMTSLSMITKAMS